MSTPLSDHFTLEDLTRSQTALRKGIDNTPSDDIVTALTGLCNDLLEPARALWGVPVSIDSGYRCPELNDAVGGANKPGHVSEHVYGRAADCIPIGLNLQEAFDQARHSDLPYDQIIFECLAWIHLGKAADGVEPRRQALLASGGPGNWHYTPVTD